MELNIRISRVPEMIERLQSIPKGAQTAVARSINDALAAGKTAVGRAVRARYNILARDVANTMRLYKASPGNLLGFIRVESARVSLFKFGARDIAPGGVQFGELKGRQSILPHSFIRTMASGHTGVFHRLDSSKSQKGRHGLPILDQVGLSVPQMAGSPEAIRQIEVTMSERVDTRLDHYIDLFLKQGSTVTPRKPAS
jgi:hypothetical protein